MAVSSGPSTVRVFPLGGLGEIGMNCLAIEQDGQVMLVDCGVTFDDRGLGVDVIHPEFAALDAFRDRLCGVFITHGHEDHIGALPYLLRRFDVPVWAPPYALGLVRERLDEHEVLQHAELIATEPRARYHVGPFHVEPIRVTHSIADATALAITTAAGVVVHSGDFKFDETPTDGEAFDTERLAELGDAGVSLLFSDSTNIDSEGYAGSEVGVGDALEPIVRDAPGAVVVAIFASNVHRLRALGDIARRTGRKLLLLGRSVGTHSRVAHATGYLDWPSDLVFPADRARELPKNKILGVATGSQGEARAALARLARGEHPSLALGDGDMVILSSRIIPGREPGVYAIFGELLRRGVTVRTRSTDRGIHVSGHAHRAEQRRMIELVRPRSFIPVHGTRHHLDRHAELARELGVKDVLVIENGQIAALGEGGLAKGGTVPSGRVFTFGGRAIPKAAIRDREVLAEGGIAVCVVIMGKDGDAKEVRVVTRGVLDEATEASLLAEARREVFAAIAALPRASMKDDAAVSEAARLAVRRVMSKELSYKPMTIAQVVREGAP
jgi:ribonuclease J